MSETCMHTIADADDHRNPDDPVSYCKGCASVPIALIHFARSCDPLKPFQYLFPRGTSESRVQIAKLAGEVDRLQAESRVQIAKLAGEVDRLQAERDGWRQIATELLKVAMGMTEAEAKEFEFPPIEMAENPGRFRTPMEMWWRSLHLKYDVFMRVRKFTDSRHEWQKESLWQKQYLGTWNDACGQCGAAAGEPCSHRAKLDNLDAGVLRKATYGTPYPFEGPIPCPQCGSFSPCPHIPKLPDR